MPTFYTYPKLLSQLLVVGKRQIQKAFGEVFIHIERSRESYEELVFFTKTFKKNSRKIVELGMNDKQNVCESVLSYNRPRPKKS